MASISHFEMNELLWGWDRWLTGYKALQLYHKDQSLDLSTPMEKFPIVCIYISNGADILFWLL